MKTMKKLLSVILAVMMVMSSLPTFAVDGIGNGAGASSIIPEGATLIFAEDFESGYTTDTDLLGDGETEIEKNGKKIIKFKNGGVEEVIINDNPTPIEEIEW